MTVQEWLESTVVEGRWGYQEPRPAARCKDGFTVSIQASSFHYCTPRINGKQQYTAVELGFPSAYSRLLTPYKEGNESQKKSIFPWTPIAVIEKVVRLHGGILGGVTYE
jgi:hypothetical protein